MRNFMRIGVSALALVLLPQLAAAAQESKVPWVTQAEGWPAQKQKLQELGERFATSWDLYEHFRKEAGGGIKLTWTDLQKPAYNWMDTNYTRAKGGLSFDPDLKASDGPTSAKLTPAGKARVDAKRAQIDKTGGEYDPISDCRPPGVPRWITEPFLHEYIVTPQQTWLINEMVNDVRRVYTDGRPHVPDDAAYPLWNGDSVGFWDGDVLVVHTKHLMSGQYQRGIQPDYSEKTELVERWRKVGNRIESDVWVFDPVNLAAPWYTRQVWRPVPNPDKMIRINYWDCRENANNSIIVKEDGTSQFKDFDFVRNDAAVSKDPAIAKGAKQ